MVSERGEAGNGGGRHVPAGAESPASQPTRLGPVYITPHKPCKSKKKSHQIFRYMYGVLNEVYLQNFLHGWAVNRETNLMSLLNP